MTLIIGGYAGIHRRQRMGGQLLSFRILGSLEVVQEDAVCTPTAPKARQTLALLLLRSNHIVSTSALVDELWGDNPPPTVVTTAQSYIYQLRKVLHPRGRQAAPGEVALITRSPGYVLARHEGQLDHDLFLQVAGQGRALLEQDQDKTSACERLCIQGDMPVFACARGRGLQAPHRKVDE
ncbi:AfsR/SARP family transcriptional regulator [Sinosporangium album]|nr:winged helix-turn-helix domain-containing protein [Sinosporangium album]